MVYGHVQTVRGSVFCQLGFPSCSSVSVQSLCLPRVIPVADTGFGSRRAIFMLMAQASRLFCVTAFVGIFSCIEWQWWTDFPFCDPLILSLCNLYKRTDTILSCYSKKTSRKAQQLLISSAQILKSRPLNQSNDPANSSKRYCWRPILRRILNEWPNLITKQ